MTFELGSVATLGEPSALADQDRRCRILSRLRPRHVALITDDSGPRATQRGLARVTGHREGVTSGRNVVLGETRVSNILLAQVPDTEIRITPTLWPDFGAHDLSLAGADCQRRGGRFGPV
jgi:undecaprenyl pyrophosphate synthase